ncbi:PA2169 family four-helix-bundle protein [Niabella sp. W65]|nr:PA2169 family four-helix-bundle protein [Niabella sp. W65]MCH7368831.1 PA2169 family four-helix-bundle protein [Niabella sp. W65]
MDVKAVFTGGDRETVLNNCEAGEDAAQKAYQMALDDEEVMPRTKELIRRQKSALKASHDQIRSLRDAVVH